MERTAEEWGRVAVGLPGWRWLPGMLQRRHHHGWLHRRTMDLENEAKWNNGDPWPNPDDAATAGVLLSLLGDFVDEIHHDSRGWSLNHHAERYPTLGRMCIASAEAFGRWPGGAA